MFWIKLTFCIPWRCTDLRLKISNNYINANTEAHKNFYVHSMNYGYSLLSTSFIYKTITNSFSVIFYSCETPSLLKSRSTTWWWTSTRSRRWSNCTRQRPHVTRSWLSVAPSRPRRQRGGYCRAPWRHSTRIPRPRLSIRPSRWGIATVQKC